jgi:hypothetical protein
VVGWLLVAAAVIPGMAALFLFWSPVGLAVFPFVVVFLVGAFLMLKLGKRLAALEPGAREAQIVASAILCLFFPLGTALGLYGLIVMAPYRTLRAMERARALSRRTWTAGMQPAIVAPAWRGHVPTPPPPLPRAPDAVIERVEVVGEEARRGPGVFLRLLAFAAVIWTVFLGLYATRANVVYRSDSARLEVESRHGRGGRYSEDPVARVVRVPRPPWNATLIAWTASGALLAAVMAFLRWPQRRERRGVGLAVFSFVLLAADLGGLLVLANRAASYASWA